MATKHFNYMQRFRKELRRIGCSKTQSNKIVQKIRKNRDNDAYLEEGCEDKFSFHDMLCCAFVWDASPEGYEYWHSLYFTLVLGESNC